MNAALPPCWFSLLDTSAPGRSAKLLDPHPRFCNFASNFLQKTRNSGREARMNFLITEEMMKGWQRCSLDFPGWLKQAILLFLLLL
jgi:hypothetical protein